MIRDRHDRTDLFALVPRLDLRFDPVLEQLDRQLDDDAIVELVRADMARRSPRSRSRGRPSTPVEVVLRMLVVMRLHGWSYEEAEYFVNDSLVLRQSCRVYLEKVPDDTTLIRWANTIAPETLQALNDRAVQLARSLKVTRGRKLRVDTTAVETNVHFPTDSACSATGYGSSLASCGGPRPPWAKSLPSWGRPSAAVPGPSASCPNSCTGSPAERAKKGARPCARPTAGRSPWPSGPAPKRGASSTPSGGRPRGRGRPT
jgi:hypothetical protein